MKKQFISGKWYKGQPQNRYIKFSHIEAKGSYNRVFYTECAYTDSLDGVKYSNGIDWWANTQFEEYALDHPVSREELIGLLPEGHPDLINEIYSIY
jgi:hypothetical protein